MTIYYCIIVLICILCFAEQYRGSQKYRLIISLGFVLILGLFAGLRGGDPDYSNYVEAYIDAGRGEENLSDVGFTILCTVLNLLSSNAVLMFVVVAFISVGLNISSFYKYTPYLCLCVLLYFVHNFALKEMIQIRAGLASALCLYSIRFINANKYKQSLLIWLLAMSIQASSIIFGLVYIAKLINPSKKLILLALLASIGIGTIYPLGQIIKGWAGLEVYSERMATYVLYGDSGYAATLGIWSNINTVKALIICSVSLYFYDYLASKFNYFRLIFLAYIVGVCWLICFNDFAIVGARMSNILMCGEPIILSYLCAIFSKNSRLAYVVGIIIVALIIFNLNIAPSKITPYTFCF